LSHLCLHSFLSLLPPPPSSTLFPYTTLFRSQLARRCEQPRPDAHRQCLGQRGRHRFGPGRRRRQVQRNHRDPRPFGEDRPRKHRSEEHTSELQSPCNLVCRLLLEKKKKKKKK